MASACALTSEGSRLVLRSLVCFTLGCQTEPLSAAQQLHADREAYVASLTRPSDPNACAAIQDPATRSECLSLVAGRISREGRVDHASALCEGLDQSVWRDECAFLVAEKAPVPASEQRRLCDASRSFSQQCRGHLLRRQSQSVLDGFGVGQEPAAYDAVLALAAEFFPRSAPAQARRIVVEHLAARLPDQPFGRVHCGSAPRDLCVSAYADRVQIAARRQHHQTHDLDRLSQLPWEPACDGVPTLARVEALGLPTWEPEANEVVQDAWRLLCSHRDTPGVRR